MNGKFEEAHGVGWLHVQLPVGGCANQAANTFDRRGHRSETIDALTQTIEAAFTNSEKVRVFRLDKAVWAQIDDAKLLPLLLGELGLSLEGHCELLVFHLESFVRLVGSNFAPL